MSGSIHESVYYHPENIQAWEQAWFHGTSFLVDLSKLSVDADTPKLLSLLGYFQFDRTSRIPVPILRMPIVPRHALAEVANDFQKEMKDGMYDGETPDQAWQIFVEGRINDIAASINQKQLKLVAQRKFTADDVIALFGLTFPHTSFSRLSVDTSEEYEHLPFFPSEQLTICDFDRIMEYDEMDPQSDPLDCSMNIAFAQAIHLFTANLTKDLHGSVCIFPRSIHDYIQEATRFCGPMTSL